MSIHLKNVRIKYINQKRQNIHVRGGKVKPPIPYLHGLIMGDVSIRFEEKIKKYRVLISTTHPSMEKVFIHAFQPYSLDGVIRKYPVKGGATSYKWMLYTWLDEKLGSKLTIRRIEYLKEAYSSFPEFLWFLAGLFDSDGSIAITINRRKRLKYKPLVEYKFCIISTNRDLLEFIQNIITSKFNIYVGIRKNRLMRKKAISPGKKQTWELAISSSKGLKTILDNLFPLIQHRERKLKAKFLLDILDGKIERNPDIVYKLREQINNMIKLETKAYISEAEEAYRRMYKYLIYQDKVIREKVTKPRRIS